MFNIGARLVELRGRRKLSANKLAIALDVSPSTINKIEKGRKQPSIPLLFNICHYFGISPSEFFSEAPAGLPPELKELLDSAEILTPEQLSRLVQFIKSMK
ncbi:MAG: helix-turn-helix transcriptional regulator [Bacillota bacterium]